MSLLAYSPLNAQGFERRFGGNKEDVGEAILQTNDYGFLFIGHTASFPVGDDQDQDVYAIRLDADGRTVWERVYDLGLTEVSRAMLQRDDNTFFIAGEVSFETVSGPFQAFLMHTSPKGDTLWTKTYSIDGIADIRLRDMVFTSEGNLLLVGYAAYANKDDDLLLLEIDQEGELLNHQVIDSGREERGEAIVALSDGGYVIAGREETLLPPPNAFGNDIITYKIGADWAIEWKQRVETAENSEAGDLLIDKEGRLVVAGLIGGDQKAALWRYDLNGNKIDSLVVQDDVLAGAIGNTVLSSNTNAIISGPNGGYVLAGSVEINALDVDYLIFSVDENLQLRWARSHGGDKGENALDLAPTIFEGYLLVGTAGVELSLVGDMMMALTDAQGNIYTNTITGRVYHDLDGSCDLDVGEKRLEGWLVRARGADETFFATTNENGVYSFLVDSGTYLLDFLMPNSNWAPCDGGGGEITFDGFYLTDTLDGPMSSEIADCPVMEVSVAAPFITACDTITYTVEYQNDGTGDADDVAVLVTLGDSLTFIDASLPSTLEGGAYRFDLGQLPYNENGSFTLRAAMACSGIATNHAEMVMAEIFPNESCSPPDPDWNGASVNVEGECLPGQVAFQISNVGTADMDEGRSYFIVEEDLVVFLNTTELPQGGDTLITFDNPEGKTYRIIAEQVPGHPGSSFPTKAVEGCGTDMDGGYSTGFVTQWPENDGDPSVSIFVDEVIDDARPVTMLRGRPKGYRDSIITAETDLSYRIFFRNPGDEVSSRIVIRDTLPVESLDLTTFTPGASSHPAEVELYETGLLRVTFTGIQLPPTTEATATLEDYAYFDFKVKQMPDNAAGTVIENKAQVIIDYQPPQVTNTVRHIVGAQDYEELLVEVVEYDLINNTDDEFVLSTGVEVVAFPNPVTDYLTLQVKNLPAGHPELEFSLVNMQGQPMRYVRTKANQFTFDRSQLARGSYVYIVRAEGRRIAAGTVIIR